LEALQYRDTMGTERVESIWQQPPPLSFGVQLQLFFATLAENIEDPKAGDLLVPVRITSGTVPKDVQATWQIAEVLNDVDISVRDPDLEGLAWVGESDTDPDGNWWVVERDDSIDGADLDSRYHWIGIRLKSPQLAGKQEGYDEVDLVVHAITSHFRVHASTACGYEVDVSNQDGSFADDLVKRLGQFLWAAEPTLSRYHDPARVALQQAQALRAGSLLAGGFRRAHAETQIAQNIEETERSGPFTWEPLALRLNNLNSQSTARSLAQPVALIDMEESDGELVTKYVTRSADEDAIHTNFWDRSFGGEIESLHFRFRHQ
jgi:hypothetical protein